jgi:hypothetical protein
MCHDRRSALNEELNLVRIYGRVSLRRALAEHYRSSASSFTEIGVSKLRPPLPETESINMHRSLGFDQSLWQSVIFRDCVDPFSIASQVHTPYLPDYEAMVLGLALRCFTGKVAVTGRCSAAGIAIEPG